MQVIARIQLNGLEHCSFSYDVPDKDLAKISGYVHVNKASRLYESAVRTWILDDRISGKIEWTLVCQANMGTGSNTRSSRESLLPVNLQAVMMAPDA